MNDEPNIRILYVDDCEHDRALVRDALRASASGFEIVEAHTRDEVQEHLSNNGFELVLSDFHLSGADGVDVINTVRTHGSALPVVIITGTGSEETAMRALRHGAADYVVKSTDGFRRLPQALLSVVRDSREALGRARRRDELERRVRECDRRLSAANRELEAFTHSVSHDLRSPLRIIDGFARMLTDEFSEDLPSKAAGHLQVIRASAARMGKLIDRLMEYSQLSSAPLSKHGVDIEALVREVLQELEGTVGQRRPAVRVEGLPPCRADRALLRQVLLNLIGNALQYTRCRQTPEITVGCRIGPGAPPAYFVKDNGVGFDMRNEDRLFKAFQRLHRPEEYDGTGMGLAIVRRIIARHGGRAWAEAVPDHGATFWFTLEGEDDGTD